MEQIPLTIKNCHRAATVRQKSHPERGGWEWLYQSHSVGNGYFSNIAKQGETSIIVSDRELQEWEVETWRYTENFESLYDVARRAFSMTSHTPETRALQYIRGYEADLQSDLAQLPKEWHFEYYAKFMQRIEDLFAKHSRIASPMITGPAKFPTARNQKANNTYEKAVEDFGRWRESYLKRGHQYFQASKTAEERELEEWEPLRKDILRTVGTIKAIDDGTDRGYRRSLFVNSIYGKVATLANNGNAGMVARAVNLIKELNEKLRKPVFTPRHKFWSLPDVCQKVIEAKAERESREDIEIPFEGGQVVKCYSEDRLQIFHDEKPAPSVIQSLKNNGFRWSPSNVCWQRQLTDNAYYAAAWVLAGADSTSDEREAWIKKFRNAK